ncbi:Aconitate hydratase A [Desulfovibrionales bacterium]
MPQNLTQKIIARHLITGKMTPNAEIGIHIDQTLTQDATGTMVYLQFEAMGIDRVRTELSVSYVDHNTLQIGFHNSDDHRYLRTVARKYGIIFSPPGTGICHQLHLENFARPGKTLIGSDSHTPTAGGIGSLAFGAGGISVAMAMAGQPYAMPMPKVVAVHLQHQITGWASAKDVILEVLRRLTVNGGVGKVMEYTGPGVATLSVPERAVIANMGAELGATTSIFPSDEATHRFLAAMNRSEDFRTLKADPDATYDEELTIDLSTLVPMAAMPHMPDRVVQVAELAGLPVQQVCIGSCTNSSYADLKSVALLLTGHRICPSTDVLVSPGSKQIVKLLAAENLLESLINSGARLLECACGPCIGMGGSPASAGVSVRTFNRNFEGRSGTQDAQVYLVSPITAAQCALAGHFTNPATWNTPITTPELPTAVPSIKQLFLLPVLDSNKARKMTIEYGPNIVSQEQFAPLPETINATVVLKVGDNITTDHILPAGAHITALRSNIPAISEYIFSRVDKGFASRIKAMREKGGAVIVAGENYGQGSSREHAALGPRHLGVAAIMAKSFARIHRANLINCGILPLILTDKNAYDTIAQGSRVHISTTAIISGGTATLKLDDIKMIVVTNDLSASELSIIRAGGLLNTVRQITHK